MPAAQEIILGSATDVFTRTQYNAGQTPKVGQYFYNLSLSFGPIGYYIFLRNSGSSAIAANQVASAVATDRAWTTTTITSTTTPTPACSLAAATNNLPFAGARVSSATSMAQNEFGWFQISGYATLTADAAGTTADAYVTTSNATAGSVEALASTNAVDAVNAFGIAETTTTAGLVKVDLTNCVWAIR